jgi:hypothetical protein
VPGIAKKKPRRVLVAYEALFSDLGTTLLRSTPRRWKLCKPLPTGLAEEISTQISLAGSVFLGPPKNKESGKALDARGAGEEGNHPRSRPLDGLLALLTHPILTHSSLPC